MRNLMRYFFMTLVLLIVALLSALTAMRLAIHGREVVVPDLHAKTPVEARRLAEDAGLTTLAERNYYSPTIPEGRVLSQMPSAGTTVRRGWEVRLALSLGPQRVAIPQAVGDSERAATISIAQRGLELGSTARVSISSATPGLVIGQNPPASATDISAPKISLLVAQETSPQAFVMPSFVGQPLGSATITLREAGFSVGRVTMAAPTTPATPDTAAAGQSPTPASPPPAESISASPASIIVAHGPAPGTKVLAGAAINFVVR
jgi:eukaryotic-like serine/threonine-protein kinase